jgi:hypothetical protein
LHSIASFVAGLFVVSITGAHADIVDVGSPMSIPITWSSKVYVAKLPPPHGTTTITIEMSDDDKLTSITMKSDVAQASIDGTMIDELTDLSEPSIGIPVDRAKDVSGHFIVSFEFGVPNKVNMPSCEETWEECVEWVKDIVNFEVDSAGNVVRDIYNVGDRLGHLE